MEIVVRCKADSRYSEEIVPDSLELVSESKGDKGIDGELLVFIYKLVMDVTTFGANVAAIASFIIMIKQELKADVSVGNSVIDKADSEEQVASKIVSEANKEIEE